MRATPFTPDEVGLLSTFKLMLLAGFERDEAGDHGQVARGKLGWRAPGGDLLSFTYAEANDHMRTLGLMPCDRCDGSGIPSCSDPEDGYCDCAEGRRLSPTRGSMSRHYRPFASRPADPFQPCRACGDDACEGCAHDADAAIDWTFSPTREAHACRGGSDEHEPRGYRGAGR